MVTVPDKMVSSFLVHDFTVTVAPASVTLVLPSSSVFLQSDIAVVTTAVSDVLDGFLNSVTNASETPLANLEPPFLSSHFKLFDAIRQGVGWRPLSP